MSNPKQYNVILHGESSLLMHKDNITFSESVTQWSKDPANKDKTVAGDDRTPAWTWVGYTYHDGDVLGMPSDNLMTMLREGGAKVTKKGKETFKKPTQSGILIDQQQWTLLIDNNPVPIQPIKNLIGNNNFNDHLRVTEELGFELLVKRAAIGRAKHIRVRPMFRNWKLVGSLTVLDDELSDISFDTLKGIFVQSGALCGIGDWRPSSGSSGTFGRFYADIEPV